MYTPRDHGHPDLGHVGLSSLRQKRKVNIIFFHLQAMTYKGNGRVKLSSF